MKAITLALALVCFFGFVGCDDDPDDNGLSDVFTIKVGNNSISDNASVSFAIYSSTGEFIEKVDMQNGQTKEISLAGYENVDKLNIQNIYRPYYPSNTGDTIFWYLIENVLNVSTRVWNYGIFNDNEPIEIGEEIVKINLLNASVRSTSINNKYSTHSSAQQNGLLGIEFSINQFYNPDNIFVWFTLDDGTYHYKWINVNEVNPVYNFALKEMDTTKNGVVVNLPASDGCSLKLYGISEESYYLLNSNFQNDNSLEIKYPLGIFIDYNTRLSYSIGDYTYGYEKLDGDVPDKVETLDFSMDIIDGSLNNFNAATTSNADIVSCAFSGTTEINGNTYYMYYNLTGSPESINNYNLGTLLPNNFNEQLSEVIEKSSMDSWWASDYSFMGSFNDFINSVYVEYAYKSNENEYSVSKTYLPQQKSGELNPILKSNNNRFESRFLNPKCLPHAFENR